MEDLLSRKRMSLQWPDPHDVEREIEQLQFFRCFGSTGDQKIKAIFRDINRKARKRNFTHIHIEHNSKGPDNKKNIFHYLCRVNHILAPMALFGSISNKRKVVRIICRVTSFGVEGDIPYRLLDDINLSEVPWMEGSDAERNIRLYKDIINIYIKRYLFVALKKRFVVVKGTKSCGGVYALVYYFKETWDTCKQRAFSMFREKLTPIIGILERKKKENEVKSLIRFLPKKEGVRPTIVSRKLNEREKSTMQLAHNLLKQMFKEERCPAVCPIKEFGQRFAQRKSVWGDQKLWCVRIDIRDAFGSVKHYILERIIDRHLNKYQNGLIGYEHVQKPGRKTKEMRFYSVNKSSKSKCFRRDDIKKYIYHQIRNTVLRYTKKKVFKMNTGLAQGAKLSAVLCDLYLNDVDINVIQRYCNFESLVCRGVDDYIYLTPSLERAVSFIRVMKRGLEFHGLKINKKTQTNDEQNMVLFYGYAIDLEKKEVKEDWTKYEGVNLGLTMGLKISRGVLRDEFVRRKLKYITKVDRILVNPEINSTETIVENVCKVALLHVRRLHCLVVRLSLLPPDEWLLTECRKVCCRRLTRALRHLPDLRSAGRYAAFAAYYIELNGRVYYRKEMKNLLKGYALKVREDVDPDLAVHIDEVLNIKYRCWQHLSSAGGV